jgi:hypothetical protein
MENKTFTLIGKFDDEITKKLRGINTEIAKLSKVKLPKKNFTSAITDGLSSANKEVKTLDDGLKKLNKYKFKFDKSGLEAANQEAKVLSTQLKDISKAGLQIDNSGLKAAQGEAKVLGDILKANALIRIGEGFSNSLNVGVQGAIQALSKGVAFVGRQFGSAVADQMGDIQARGSLYGSLKKQEVLTGKSIEEQKKDYRQTKIIARANEQAIGQLIRESSVSTGVVTTLNRQLTDNILPSILKSRGVKDLGSKSRSELDQLFGGEKGIGTELARLYEQMATIIPSPQYASMSAMGFTQVLTAGRINRQLNVFENNPVLVDALQTIDGGVAATSDIGKRIQILKKALEVAAPSMMLDEMKSTISGGMQAVQDTITNPTVGILSLGADVANEGARTLQQYKDSGAYRLQMDRAIQNIQRSADKMKLKGEKRRLFVEEERKKSEETLIDAISNADAPIEKISVGLGPVLQSFASFLSSFGVLFIDPVTSMMNSLYKPLASLQRTFDILAGDVEKQKRSIGNALGRAFAEIFKALTIYFNPEKAGKEIGDGIQSFFKDFMEGFTGKGVDGPKYMKMVLDTLWEILNKSLFNEGNWMKGVTPLGDALLKVFTLLAAPAFISALISGFVPLILLFGSQFFGGLAKKGLDKLVASGILKRTLEKIRPPVYPSSPLPPTPAPAKPAKLSMLARAKGGFSQLGGAISGSGPKIVSFFKDFGTMGPKFMSIFKGVVGKFAIVGAIVTAVISLFSGEGLARALAEGAGPLFGAVLGAALLPFLGPIGPMVGAWIGSLEPVVSFFEGVFTGVGMVFSETMTSLGFVFEALGGIVGAVWNSLVAWIPRLGEASGQFSILNFTIGVVLLALHPFISAINLIALAFNGLRLAFLSFDQWINNTFQGGNRSGRIQAEIDKTLSANARVAQAQVDLNTKTGAFLSGKGLEELGSKAKGVSKSLESTSAQQTSHLGKLKVAQAQSVDTESKIRKNWATVNVGSQTQLLKSANSLSTAISSAASKINNASINLRGNNPSPGSMASPASRGFTPGRSNRKMALDEALASEMRNKPSGSHLVIANSSEAVIPAAGGYTPGRGPLSNLGSSLSQYMNPLETLGSMADELKKLRQSSPLMGGGKGGLSSAKSLAAMFGLTLTSHVRPFSIGSYHQFGRAMDFSDGVNTPGMMKFAKEMVSRYGSSLAELIYSPLGFSVKNGRKVPPMAAGSHWDHVHVAFGLGPSNPAFFSSQSEAVAWEKKMMPNSARVSSVTTNSSEGFGNYTLSAPITIYQQPHQDSEELANAVAIRLSMAIEELRNHNA